MWNISGVRFAKFEFYRTTVNEVRIRKLEFHGMLINLDYSRIEFAADARHRVCSCGSPPQMLCNEADAVKSARPKGKLCRYIIKRNAFETD